MLKCGCLTWLAQCVVMVLFTTVRLAAQIKGRREAKRPA